MITGPSGVGKGTLIRALLERVPELELSVSATTRAPRAGERDGVEAETAVLDGRVGGRLYERVSDGTEADWGRLHVWEPPHRVAFEWFVTGTPTDVDVRFVPEGDDATRVELVHSGFDRIEDAERRRAGYDEGWALGLRRYAETVSLP